MNVRSGMTGIGQAVNSVNSPWEKLMTKFKENQQRYKDAKDKDAKWVNLSKLFSLFIQFFSVFDVQMFDCSNVRLFDFHGVWWD